MTEEGPPASPAAALRKFAVPSLAAVLTLAGGVGVFWGAWQAHGLKAGTHTTTNSQSEPFIRGDAVKAAYAPAPIPALVDDVILEYNQLAREDLANETQDFQTEDSPGITCDRYKTLVVRVFGHGSCDKGNAFVEAPQTERRYDRTLIRVAAEGQFPTLAVPKLKRASRHLHAAETRAVGCTIHNESDTAATVDVTTGADYQPLDQTSTPFQLDPHDTRTLLYLTGERNPGLPATPACTFDAQPTNLAKVKPGWVWLVEFVVVLVLGALAVRGSIRQN